MALMSLIGLVEEVFDAYESLLRMFDNDGVDEERDGEWRNEVRMWEKEVVKLLNLEVCMVVKCIR